MHRIICALLLILVATHGSRAQETAPLSDRRVSYELQVTLDSEAKMLHGRGHMTWRNPDVMPVDTLQFHLYLNAFRDGRSTFMRGYGHPPAELSTDNAWGWIRFEELTTAAGADLADSVFFLQPQDGNPHDATVAAVRLPAPVMPGETARFGVTFTAQLPFIVARTGYQERHDGQLFVMAAQWFPKFGVYEVPGQRYMPTDASRGRWNTHQFHVNSEFYADFGIYDITIDVPEGYVIGASGVRLHAEEAEGRRTERYLAEDVHDFAWTASPAFLEFTETWGHVTMRLLLQPEHRGQKRRHFDAARIALEGYGRLVGPYPYTTLTLVDGLGESNGMEYPTLILCGTTYMAPPWVRIPEMILIHEFGHQYFYGMLASNEAEEAWLDEGINSYLEGKVMDAAYGPGSLIDLPGAPVSNPAMHRAMYALDEPERGALFTRSWDYASRWEYGKTSYSKSATVLHALEGYLGAPRMEQVLRTYFARWRFRHPTTQDFRAVVEEVSGEDLTWFFDQFVYGTAVVDYAADGVHVLEEDEGEVVSSVQIVRRRDGVFPQVVRIFFADGTTQDRAWDGEASDTTFTFTYRAPATRAVVDPDFLVRLDVNRLNNGATATSSRAFATRYTMKFTAWMQFAFRVLESLF